MSIYAIGDLHLSLNKEKPMDIFGDNWIGHEEKIKDNWTKQVKENDLILLVGDFSWKMHLEDMYEDFKYLSNLPGKKILLKGNHDYWWNTLKKMREYISINGFSNIDFLYNNSYEYENIAIVGTRGWAFAETDEDMKINHREVERLKLSINDAIKNYPEKEIICMMHYPPINNKMISSSGNNTEKEDIKYSYINVMKEYNIKRCIYGHLHGEAQEDAFEGIYDGIEFKLVSADYLNFKLLKLI